MSLSRVQRDFAHEVGKFLVWIYENGYEVTLGDAYRDPRLHGDYGDKKAYGRAKSYHKKRLAIDLNLFIDDEYQFSTEAYEPLGIEWEKRGGTWGGRFDDGNHFSWGE